MSTFEKIWRGIIKILIYLFTPIFLFYCVCFIISTFTINGVLWNCIEIPNNLFNLANKVNTIGAIPAIISMVAILIQLGNIAFRTNTQNKKNSLNMAVIDNKMNLILKSQKVFANTLNEIQNNTLTIEDNRKLELSNELNSIISQIDRNLSTVIDFENLDIENIKKQLLALKDMTKGISTLINK